MEPEEVRQASNQGVPMRIASFLFALSLLTISFFLRGSSAQHSTILSRDLAPSQQGQMAPQSVGDGIRMLRQDEIRVLPTELVAANRAELASLRDRVTQAEIAATRVEVSDPAVREQLARQLQLAKALLSYAERQDSEDGKSAVVLEVEHRLNRIEGRTMCEACHGVSFKSNGIGE